MWEATFSMLFFVLNGFELYSWLLILPLFAALAASALAASALAASTLAASAMAASAFGIFLQLSSAKS